MLYNKCFSCCISSASLSFVWITRIFVSINDTNFKLLSKNRNSGEFWEPETCKLSCKAIFLGQNHYIQWTCSLSYKTLFISGGKGREIKSFWPTNRKNFKMFCQNKILIRFWKFEMYELSYGLGGQDIVLDQLKVTVLSG